ncbi:MAG: phage portal protein [Dehalococcoidales bacterium]|nr:MAG: phage portal protein [Dehalococcoidales bacterium]
MGENFDPSELERRDIDRRRGYQELLDFYHGVHWEGRERRAERRLTFNYAKVFIDKAASYLMSGTGFVIEPGDDSEETRARAGRAEVALHKVAQENNLEQLDFETEIDCAVLGDACYKVIWDQETKSVRVTTPDIQGIYVWWGRDDSAKIWQVASRYSLNADVAENLYQIKPKDKQAINLIELWTAQEFELWVDGNQVESKPNPYGFIPFVIYPNLREPKRFWGVSDLLPIMEPQRELNRATSQLSKILELSGNPIAVLENVEESKDIAIRPGSVWNIPEDAKAYLLDLLQGGGVRLHIDYINILYRILHDLSESPRAAFGGTERDLSGVALEIELQPLLQKVRRKRIIRNAVYQQRSRLILKLLEKYQNEDFSNVNLRVIWAPVLPQDMAKLVSNEQALVQNGIHSRRRAMDEIGVQDPEMEFDRWLEEREAILRMNKEINGKLPRGGERARNSETPAKAARQPSP